MGQVCKLPRQDAILPHDLSRDWIAVTSDSALPEQPVVGEVSISHGTVQTVPDLTVGEEDFARQQQMEVVLARLFEMAILANAFRFDVSGPSVGVRDVESQVIGHVAPDQRWWQFRRMSRFHGRSGRLQKRGGVK